jgi:molybdenum cofactor cytidylyltransferase
LISAIVLAAGLSTRMGKPKLLLRVEGEPILGKVLAVLRHSRVDEVVVVLGADARRTRKAVRFESERIVVNPKYSEGMSSSLRLGLRKVSPDADAALVVLGDQPYLSSSTVDRIIEEYLAKNPPVVVPVYGGTRGNPVLFARAVFADVMRISGDVGAKSVVDKYRDRVLEVPVRDAGILFDVDTPSDYQRASSRQAMRRRIQEAA